MTIDEAIAKYKEITNTDVICPAHCNISCDKCVQESEQLADWLEELKDYRKYIELTEIPEQYKLGFQDGIVNGFENGYNKAIDDFADKLKQDVMTITFGLRICDIDRIAEQLKGR